MNVLLALIACAVSFMSPNAQLIENIAQFRFDPLKHTQFVYPWGEGSLKNHPGPRVWQGDILQLVGEHLQNPETRFQVLRLAVASGHGIGKSALFGMLTNWAMNTCVDCKVIITANTGGQLKTKTVPEIHKWFNLGITRHWWNPMATSIATVEESHKQQWRLDFIPWSENNTEAFQGAHNQGKRLVVIFDESSNIAPAVWEATEGALTDENTEIIWLAFGNPTRNTGRFQECFGSLSHRWITRQIDSRHVEGTNKEQIAQWIADYGEDSDFVRVRVRGEFPRASSAQFIPNDIVALCRKFKAVGYMSLPKIFIVDVARFGDDRTVMGMRQGRRAEILAKYRNKDIIETGNLAIEWIGKENPDFVVVDGDGLGAGVVDHLRHMGYGRNLIEFHGGGTPSDPAAYFNKRAECWGAMRDWLKAGAEIPDDPELETDLTSPEYGFSNKQQIQLERKEDMKSRGLASPDCGDMLAMSFAANFGAKSKPTKRYVQPGGPRGWMAV